MQTRQNLEKTKSGRDKLWQNLDPAFFLGIQPNACSRFSITLNTLHIGSTKHFFQFILLQNNIVRISFRLFYILSYPDFVPLGFCLVRILSCPDIFVRIMSFRFMYGYQYDHLLTLYENHPIRPVDFFRSVNPTKCQILRNYFSGILSRVSHSKKFAAPFECLSAKIERLGAPLIFKYFEYFFCLPNNADFFIRQSK